MRELHPDVVLKFEWQRKFVFIQWHPFQTQAQLKYKEIRYYSNDDE